MIQTKRLIEKAIEQRERETDEARQLMSESVKMLSDGLRDINE
jgi:hypothetical protein